jgi:SAM-dependent methyltransferase
MEKEQAGKTEDAARSDEERRLVQAYERRKTTVDPRRDGWFAPANIQARHDRERRVLRLLDRYGFVPLKNVKVFEVGCGSGYWLREFIKWGVQPENIAGVDLLPDRVASAVRSCPQGVSVRCGSAAQLDVPDESYDIVLQSL